MPKDWKMCHWLCVKWIKTLKIQCAFMLFQISFPIATSSGQQKSPHGLENAGLIGWLMKFHYSWWVYVPRLYIYIFRLHSMTACVFLLPGVGTMLENFIRWNVTIGNVIVLLCSMVVMEQTNSGIDYTLLYTTAVVCFACILCINRINQN